MIANIKVCGCKDMNLNDPSTYVNAVNFLILLSCENAVCLSLHLLMFKTEAWSKRNI